MTLPFLITNPELEIECGDINSFEYAITANDYGFRCGYLKVLPGHPWCGFGYDDFDADVHGGLTFAQRDKISADLDGEGWWLGFDCAHAWDAPDPELPGYQSGFINAGEIRSTQYVRDQLINLARQAQAAQTKVRKTVVQSSNTPYLDKAIDFAYTAVLVTLVIVFVAAVVATAFLSTSGK